MAKYTVVLIDDEPIILQGLQILIDWQAYDLEIIGSATDGLEGLKLIKEQNPDIVISDIQMPNCSGVDMISQVRTFSDCEFIILSGYSDFAYAQQCISYGVQEYLLKPIEENALTKALEKVKTQIDFRKKSNEAFSQLHDISQQLLALTLDDILRDLMNSYFETNEDFFLTLSDYDLFFPKGEAFCAIAIQFGKTENLKDLRWAIADTFTRLDAPHLLFYYGTNIYVGIFSLADKEQTFTENISVFHNELHRLVDCDLCIGIGNIYTNAFQLPVSCKQALCALSYKIIRGANSINPFHSSFENAYFIQTVPVELWTTYHKSLMQSNFASISTAIRKIFHYMNISSGMPLLGIQINTLNLIMTCIQHLAENPSYLSVSYENADFMKQISSMQSADELQRYTENVIYNLLNNGWETNLPKPNELISKIENYINSNFLEDLSLITVAQLFYISPTYLSQTFKKQTGQLYLDYVTEVKINAAKKMLLTTDLMVYEIADRLHYKDSKYFSKLFEKRTGKKPSEYRKNT